MLWLGRLVRRWRGDRGRRIFRFEVDGRPRWADPFKLCEALERECPRIDDLLAVVRGAAPELPGSLARELRAQRDAAGKELVRAARVMFGLPEFDGSGPRPAGVTEAEAVAVLCDFVAWLGSAADDARPTPG